MKTVSAMAFLLALLTFSVSAVAQSTAISPCANCGLHGAPGPVAGAGIPLLVVGAGFYWLIRRRRKNS